VTSSRVCYVASVERMATGLRESRSWTDREVKAYLDALIPVRFDP
jgi:hypothetical protein